MLTKRIIPCLDVTDGRVVKGTSFLNLRDAGDPVELAARYGAEGADELVLLDITASSDHRETMVEVVERTADTLFIPFTVGGGIRTVEDVRRLLNAGADKVGINTAGLLDPQLIARAADKFGSQAIVLAVDAKRVTPPGDPEPRWEVYTHGGRRPTGVDAIEWARRGAELGAGEILLTSMDADGQQDGYDIALTRAVSEAVPVPVIASGGAGTLDHLRQALADGRADAVLAASIFHYGTYTIHETKAFLAGHGLPIRTG